MDVQRKIIHIDMDAFYAAVEQRDNPDLRGKPIAVGGGKKRGVVATASYEARKFGVRSAISGVQAAKLCPNLIFVTPRFDVYHSVSDEIRSIFHEYTDFVEPLSLDEAYLDVTVNKKGMPSATLLAEEIRMKIFQKTNLTASAGVSYNKFLAKVASDINKPNGCFVIRPKDSIQFLNTLPIEKFFGIGKKTSQKMKSFGIYNGLLLREKELYFLVKHFGKAGKYFYDIARGIDTRPVISERMRKSIGTEKTFETDINTVFACITELYYIAKDLHQAIVEGNYKGKTLVLKIKYHDFTQHTHSKTVNYPLTDFKQILTISKSLLSVAYKEGEKVRLMGLTLTNFADEREDIPQLFI
ncbi:MAG: DNA polymerase IV [Bacteroidales bacterium]|jgi:DNA polymerase-4|nr:DNA polymerase IV [Bacteroidales bacterium]